jgi:hypothetical protein
MSLLVSRDCDSKVAAFRIFEFSGISI